MDTITVAQGTDQDNTITLYDVNGALVTTFTNADIPGAVVWSGSDFASIFSPTVAWVDPTQGTLELTISGANTAGIDPARYHVRVFINTTDSRTIDAWAGWLVVEATAGTEAVPSTYCSYGDLLNFCPWLDDELGDRDTSGFVRQRHLARTWLESVLQKHFRWNGGYWGLDQFGFATQPVMQGYGHSPQLQAWLDADLLIVNDLVTEIVCKRALGLILQSSVPPSRDPSPYQAAAWRYLAEANALVSGLIAEISVNHDGITSFMIPCNVLTTRS